MINKKFNTYIGIKISETKLEIKYNDKGSVISIPNKYKSFKKLKSYFGKDKKCVLVLLEAANGYENALVKWLLSKDISVAIVKNKYLKDFAKLNRQQWNNYTIDAAVVRKYGQAYMQTLYFEKERNELEENIELLKHKRNLLLSARDKQKCKLSSIKNKEYLHQTKEAIRYFDNKLTSIEKQLKKALKKDNKLLKKIQLSLSTKTLMPIETYTIIGKLPNMVQASLKENAALISLVSFRKDYRKVQRQKVYLA